MGISESVKGIKKAQAVVDNKLIAFSLFFSMFLIAFLLLFITSLVPFQTGKNLHNYVAYEIADSVVSGSFLIKIKRLNYYDKAGNKIAFQPKNYKKISYLSESRNAFSSTLKKAFFFACFFGLFLAIFATYFFDKYQRTKERKKFIRGAKFVPEEDLKKLIEEGEEETDFYIGKVPLAKRYENRHIGFFGDSGSGKSQQIMMLMDLVREREEKALILDKSGEFIEHYYDSEKDVILSPFDARSCNWTPFNEGTELFDFERLAQSYIPSNKESKEDHWPESAVTVFSWLLYRMERLSKDKCIDDLFRELVFSENQVHEDMLGNEHIVKIRGINKLLKNSLAELVIDPDSPEHASSVIASLLPKIRSMWYMRGLNEKQSFSFRDWAKNDSDKRWVFIRVTEDELDAVRPTTTAWIDTVIKTVISLDQSKVRKLWAFIDEMQSLGKINSLNKAAQEGRKYDLRLVLGFTSINELFNIYGEYTTKAMLSMLGTKLIYRTSEPSAAKWNSEVLGEEELIIMRKSESKGKNPGETNTETKEKNPIVSYSEIENLSDLSAYLKLAGNYPVTKVHFEYKARETLNKRTEPREIPDDPMIDDLKEETKKKPKYDEPLI